MDEMEVVRKINQLLYSYRHESKCMEAREKTMRHREMFLLDGILKMGNRVRMNEISSYFKITPAAVSQIIKAFEKKGWVKREYDQMDKRSVYIVVTDETIAYLEQKQQATIDRFVRFVNTLGEEDAQAFVRILEKGLAFRKEEILKQNGKE